MFSSVESDGSWDGVALWFECDFSPSSVVLDTGPSAPETHWKQTVVLLPEGKAVLTQWEDAEGSTFDAAFRQQDEAWVLDWDHFVHYRDHSWHQFLAGSGESVGEFRLLARKRLAISGDPGHGIGVVLSAPKPLGLDRHGFNIDDCSSGGTNAHSRMSARTQLHESRIAWLLSFSAAFTSGSRSQSERHDDHTSCARPPSGSRNGDVEVHVASGRLFRKGAPCVTCDADIQALCSHGPRALLSR